MANAIRKMVRFGQSRPKLTFNFSLAVLIKMDDATMFWMGDVNPPGSPAPNFEVDLRTTFPGVYTITHCCCQFTNLHRILTSSVCWFSSCIHTKNPFLTPQSGARINSAKRCSYYAFRDFHAIQSRFKHSKPVYVDLKWPKVYQADRCRATQTKADHGRPKQTKAK